MSVLLPEPETPVTQIRRPAGTPHHISSDCSRARRARHQRLAAAGAPRPAARCAACPLRYCPVSDRDARISARSCPAPRPGRRGCPARAHLQDVVGGADRLLVVLDHDHRVADVAQALQRGDHLDVVLGCRPMLGSSSTYSMPISPEPIWWRADALRLAAERVAALRFRFR